MNKSTSSLAAILILIVLGVIACGTDSNPAATVARARAALEQGDTRIAVIELKTVLQSEPDNAEARLLLGRAYLASGAGAQAEKELGRAMSLGVAENDLRVDLTRSLLLQGKYRQIAERAEAEQANETGNNQQMPESVDADLRALYGNAFQALGRLDEADAFYLEALSLDPENREAELGQAQLLLVRGDPDAARLRIETLVSRFPGWSEAWSDLGDIERREGNAQAAEIAYNHAIDSGSIALSDRMKRALVRIRLTDYEGAENDIAAAEQRAPELPELDYLRGLIALQQLNYASALASFQETLSINPRHMPAMYHAGLAAAHLEQWEQAESHLSRFVAAYPNIDVAAKVVAAVRLQLLDYRGVEEALTPVVSRNPTDAAALELLGEAALRSGDATASVNHFRKVVALAPESANANFRLGLGMAAAGQNEDAIESLTKAAKLAPEELGPDYALFQAYVRSSELQKALEIAEIMRDKAPTEAFPWNLIGSMRLALGDESGAREALNKALELQPGFGPAAMNLGNLERSQGNRDQAIALYKQILEHHPGHIGATVALVELEEQGGNNAGALRYLELAVEAKPQEIRPRVMLARRYRLQGNPTKALGTLAPAETTFPSHPALLLEKGEAQLAAGQPRDAQVTFKRLTESAPTSAGAYLLLSRAAAAAGDRASALSALEETVRLDPTQLRPGLVLAGSMVQQGKYKQAQDILDALRASHAEAPEVDGLAGDLAMAQGDAELAASAYRRALGRKPTSYWTVGLARSLWAGGKRAEALDTLEQRLRVVPQDPLIQHGLIDAYTNLDDQAKSVEGLQDLIRVAPNNWLALNNLAWLIRDEDPALALSYARQALDLMPDSAMVQDTAGVLSIRNGELEQGLVLLEQAAASNPSNLDTQFHLAEALAASGRTDDALNVLQTIIGDDSAAFVERDKALALRGKLQTN